MQTADTAYLDAKLGSAISTKRPARGRHLGALVLDADYRGLAVVRSLGRRGIPVWVLEHGDHWLAALSRYSRRTLRWPSYDGQHKVDFLLHLAQREAIRDWVLFPTGDEAAALVARHHQTLGEQFQLTTQPWHQLQWSYDKRLSYRLADVVGVGRPWTVYPADRDQLQAHEYPYPVILKPAYRNSFNRFTAAKAWRIDNQEQLLARFDEARALVDPGSLMIQELIPGNGESQLSYTALCRDGQPIASLTAKRARQIPMDFGRASTFVETVDDQEASAAAARLLKALSYTGVVEVEFKRDPRDRKLKLLDINPRVWGWQSLCGPAGVDYPYLLWLLTLGEPIPPTKAIPGVRWVRMTTDAPVVVREILRGRLPIRDYLRSIHPPLVSAVFASDDPWPGILEIPLLAYLAGKKMFSGGRMA